MLCNVLLRRSQSCSFVQQWISCADFECFDKLLVAVVSPTCWIRWFAFVGGFDDEMIVGGAASGGISDERTVNSNGWIRIDFKSWILFDGIISFDVVHLLWIFVLS